MIYEKINPYLYIANYDLFPTTTDGYNCLIL